MSEATDLLHRYLNTKIYSAPEMTQAIRTTINEHESQAARIRQLEEIVAILGESNEHYLNELNWNTKPVKVHPCPPGIAYAGQQPKGYSLAQDAAKRVEKLKEQKCETCKGARYLVQGYGDGDHMGECPRCDGSGLEPATKVREEK